MTAAHDTYELRVLARIDAALASPPVDPSRTGTPTARLAALRELARSTYGSTRAHFLREAQALELQVEEQAAIEAWNAANACTCRSSRGHTPWCALKRRRAR